jgi:hypothetical protein
LKFFIEVGNEPMIKKENNDYFGKRKRRGLFQSSYGIIINADINGAIGIVRKVVGNSFVQMIIDRIILLIYLYFNLNSFVQMIIDRRAFLRPVKTNIYI